MKHVFAGVSATLISLMVPLAAAGAPPPPGTPPSVLVRSKEVLLTPFPVAKVIYFDNAGTEHDVPWATLTGAVQRSQLPNESLFVEIRRVTQDGSISILPVQVTASKGEYEFVYRWMKYRTQYCSATDQSAGFMRVGVGLDVVIRVSTRKSNLNVSGLGPVTAAARDSKFTGSLNVDTIGLGTNSAALAGFLGNSGISEESANDAGKAIAVVKAVIENNETILTPHTLSVIERTPGACTGVAPAIPQRTVIATN